MQQRMRKKSAIHYGSLWSLSRASSVGIVCMQQLARYWKNIVGTECGLSLLT